MALHVDFGLVSIGTRFAIFVARGLAPGKDRQKRPTTAHRFIGESVATFNRMSCAVRLAAALVLRIAEEIDALRAGKLPSWAALARKAPCPKATGPKATPMSELAEAVAAATGLHDTDKETAPEDLYEAVEA